MSAEIINLEEGTKILNKAQFSRDSNGLETLEETYTIRSSDRLNLLPAKGTTHSNFSTSSIKNPYMAVDSVSTNAKEGDLTEMTVKYTGLPVTAAGVVSFPPPILRILPSTGSGIWGPPIIIEVEYATDLSEAQIATGQLVANTVVSNYYRPGVFIPMPTSINGLTLPPNPRNPGYTINNVNGYILYYGYCIDTLAAERKGGVVVARVTFKEKQFGQGLFTSATIL